MIGEQYLGRVICVWGKGGGDCVTTFYSEAVVGGLPKAIQLAWDRISARCGEDVGRTGKRGKGVGTEAIIPHLAPISTPPIQT